MHPLTETWWRLFVNRTDGALRSRGHGWYFDPVVLTKRELSSALAGKQPLGIYATTPQGRSRWLCLDADTVEGREALIAIAGRMEAGTYLFEPSRRGAHLWRFCPPTPWQVVRAYGEFLLEEAGVTCEVFPKGEGRTGVRVPLTPHPKTGVVYPIIDPGTGELLEPAALMALQSAPLPPVSIRKRMTPTMAVALTGERGDFGTLVREIEGVTRLRQYGPERAIGRCPFHDDRHPSLSVLGGFWRCWTGCGEGGVNAFARVCGREGEGDDDTGVLRGGTTDDDISTAQRPGASHQLPVGSAAGRGVD